ncbi:phosphatidylserine synthase [Vibrio sp. 10N.286.49.C2]|uniref:CDP-diacylglycerol--serine O-phosphatidyltransferase n=1 Tax=unclassified Vibrio TaxID=2614977 RepID=UPI000C8498D1|nr:MULTISPECIES: CDP-diacylglycerol--serine O-phosphatidyltransferase [unclassified Vibrio]PMH35551.1 phosphatidylserine synthase [Vibrio sp. 10N.286.49.C2]PMH49840.1 phosphatidylserine synthase [Vibrio sp. 10N.286.49.B1]PMH81776.1 phosphatidylserine synthase [Vibrio sp. 10N.286.48.B7]
MMALRKSFEQLPSLAQDPDQFEVLYSANDYREYLIQAIREAQSRIYLVALYLEDDDAGREVLSELYLAKQRNPDLDIAVCVDWHRAQRGLIGAAQSDGNATMYREFRQKNEHGIPVYGIPVRGREVFGVLHLKGFIVDDKVIYSGASLNNIYLNYQERYRFDRYHVLGNAKLAESMVYFIQNEMVSNPAVNDLSLPAKPTAKDIKAEIRQLRGSLSQAQYVFDHEPANEHQVSVTPLVGIGKRRNKLNHRITQLLALATDEIFICTPYFNFPKPVAKEIKKALKRGVKVTIVVGDKTANDFYISPEEEFKTIGGLPYLYEMNLRRFAKANEAHIASRQLSLNLWKHEDNSFHLKGLWVDKRYMLITGNNLNPRAWKLDLENAILIQDNYAHLTEKFDKEVANILQHTQLICTYKQLEKIEHYPEPVQKLIKKITRVSADKVLKQIL